MSKNDGQSLADERLDSIEERIPFHECVIGSGRAQQGALHVCEPAKPGEFSIKQGAHFAGDFFAFKGRNSGHTVLRRQPIVGT